MGKRSVHLMDEKEMATVLQQILEREPHSDDALLKSEHLF
jgi:hypothetical protein